jgi:hypothetical protein
MDRVGWVQHGLPMLVREYNADPRFRFREFHAAKTSAAE